MGSLPPLKLTPAQLKDSQATGIIAGNLTVAILASIAVGSRLLARRLQKVVVGYDDFCVLLALPFGWGMCVATICAVHYGLGKHMNTLQLSELTDEAKAYFASELCWAVATCLTKISILLLYVRIFGRLLYIRHLATAMGVLTLCWAIMVFLVLCFQCQPIKFIWDKSVSGTCINSWLFFVIGSTINSFTDVVILLIPIRATWNLQMSKAQKMSIIGIFLLGSLTCIISFIRLGSIIQDNNNPDFTWATGRVSIWSTAEPCLGIVAACLPTMRPLVGRVIAKCSKFSSGSYLSRMRDRRSMNNQSSDNSYGSAANRSRNFQRIPGLESDPSTNTQICSVKDDVRDSNHNIREIPLHVIEVETRTSWEDHQKQSDYTGSTKRM